MLCKGAHGRKSLSLLKFDPAGRKTLCFSWDNLLKTAVRDPFMTIHNWTQSLSKQTKPHTYKYMIIVKGFFGLEFDITNILSYNSTSNIRSSSNSLRRSRSSDHGAAIHTSRIRVHRRGKPTAHIQMGAKVKFHTTKHCWHALTNIYIYISSHLYRFPTTQSRPRINQGSAFLERGRESRLVIDNVTYDYQGEYECRATNYINGQERTVASDPISLQVVGAPQVLRLNPVGLQSVSVRKGESATLSLVVCADPRPRHVAWEWGSMRLEAGAGFGKLYFSRYVNYFTWYYLLCFCFRALPCRWRQTRHARGLLCGDAAHRGRRSARLATVLPGRGKRPRNRSARDPLASGWYVHRCIFVLCLLLCSFYTYIPYQRSICHLALG